MDCCETYTLKISARKGAYSKKTLFFNWIQYSRADKTGDTDDQGSKERIPESIFGDDETKIDYSPQPPGDEEELCVHHQGAQSKGEDD